MFMNSVDDETIMITVFGSRTTVGLVRFYSSATAQNVDRLHQRAGSLVVSERARVVSQVIKQGMRHTLITAHPGERVLNRDAQLHVP